MSVRKRVLQALKHAGLNGRLASERLGIRPPTLSEGLQRNDADWKHLPRVAEMCDVELAWLRTGEECHAPQWALPRHRQRPEAPGRREADAKLARLNQRLQEETEGLARDHVSLQEAHRQRILTIARAIDAILERMREGDLLGAAALPDPELPPMAPAQGQAPSNNITITTPQEMAQILVAFTERMAALQNERNEAEAQRRRAEEELMRVRGVVAQQEASVLRPSVPQAAAG